MNKKKTTTAQKNACLKYQRKKERVTVLLDIGTKDRIKARNGSQISLNAYINKLINDDLRRADIEQNNPFSDLLNL